MGKTINDILLSKDEKNTEDKEYGQEFYKVFKYIFTFDKPGHQGEVIQVTHSHHHNDMEKQIH